MARTKKHPDSVRYHAADDSHFGQIIRSACSGGRDWLSPLTIAFALQHLVDHPPKNAPTELLKQAQTWMEEAASWND